MKIDLKHDLATLTTVNELAINRLFDKVTWCVSDAVDNALLNKEDTVEVDMGYGTIIIKINADNVSYKFVPSKAFDKAVVNTIVTGRNELELNIESSLVSKLSSIYKEMF